MARCVESCLDNGRVAGLPVGHVLSSTTCAAVAHYGPHALVRHRIFRGLVFRLLPCPLFRTRICLQGRYARIGAVFIGSSQNRPRCGGRLRGRWLSALCRLFLLGLRLRLCLRFCFLLSLRIGLRFALLLRICCLLCRHLELFMYASLCFDTLRHGLPVGFKRCIELIEFSFQLLQIGGRFLRNIGADFSRKRRASAHARFV